MTKNKDVDDSQGFPKIEESELPGGLIEDPTYFTLSDDQLLVDSSEVVSGYAKSGKDEEHVDEGLIATVFLKVDGRVNGTSGTVHKDATLILSPEAAAKIARGLVHALSHFPPDHLGFDPDEMFGEDEETYHHAHDEARDAGRDITPPEGWEVL